MLEHEKRIEDTNSRKAKIRERYKGISADELEMIPAIPQADFYDDEDEKRVAVYARVSTDDPRQTSSYELQKNYYTDFVRRHPNWKLVDIYPDEGISGTSLRHRDEFNRMIADCHAGKIDLIVTKSVSRFARNIVDCIGLVRQLAALSPPVGVFFETERIYTLNGNSEMSLAFIATLAQEESHTKSSIMNASIEMRFAHGIFLTPPLLGYDQDENGDLVINEDEAKTVRLIFFMYLYGYTCAQIAETLTTLGRPTKRGNTVWTGKSVLGILQNERHCGEVLSRKTFTPNYLDHKSKKNRGDRNQYRKTGHHEAIISPADFVAVQRLISNAKYGNKGILPELHVIADGALKGFVLIHPRWASFRAVDYIAASNSVFDASGAKSPALESVEAQSGDLDMRGFEIARSQFFDTSRKVCVTFSSRKVMFSKACIEKLGNITQVEILVHPTEHLLAIRPCGASARNGIRWAKSVDGRLCAKEVGGMAFLGTIFELFGWNTSYKYRVRGIRRQKEEQAILVFDMHDTEVFIPTEDVVKSKNSEETHDRAAQRIQPVPVVNAQREIVAYPLPWGDSFGMEYYRHAQARELAAIDQKGLWNIADKGEAFHDKSPVQATSLEEIDYHIQQIMEEFQKEG